jgi:DNA-binding NtrC family response regulator
MNQVIKMKENQITANQERALASELKQIKNTPAILNNRLEALTVLINSAMFELEELKQNTDSIEKGKIDFDREVQQFETDLIRCALMKTGGIQRRAAALLNIKVTTLNAKIKRFGISPNGLIEDGGLLQ